MKRILIWVFALVAAFIVCLFAVDWLVKTNLINRTEGSIIHAALLTIPAVSEEFGGISSLSLDGGEATLALKHDDAARGTYRYTLRGINDSGRLRVAWTKAAAARDIQIEVARTYSDLPPKLLYSGNISIAASGSE